MKCVRVNSVGGRLLDETLLKFPNSVIVSQRNEQSSTPYRH